MTHDERLQHIRQLEQQLRYKIPLKKFKRTKIIQEEIVDAYRTPVPSSIQLSNNRIKQVEKNDWILIHPDGTESTYTDDEFRKVFEPISLGQTFKEPIVNAGEVK